MVATLLKLKLRLVIAEMRRSVARMVIYLIIGINALISIIALLAGLVAASFFIEGNEVLAGTITIICGSIIVVGWTILPLLFFGTDQTLDPARFTLFPLTGRKLAPGLVLSGALGIPGLITALIALGSALPWLRSPVVLLIGIVGGVLGFLMSQVCCRAASTALSGSLSSRKAKDLLGIIGVIVVLILSMSGYAISLAFELLAGSSGGLLNLAATAERISSVLAWTPLGAPWALAADAASGQWGLLLGHLVVTVIYLVLGLRLYAAALDKALITPARAGSTAVARHDSIARAGNWIWANGALEPVAAITARCLRYWRRDPRYLGQIPSVLLVFILFVMMGVTMPMLMPGEDAAFIDTFAASMIGFGLAFGALMTGYILCADIASDASAWWLHLTCSVKGWQDRLGRIIAQAVWAVPLIVLSAIVIPIFLDNPARIPTTLGVMVTLYLTGAASAAVFSALIIFPVPLPGESPLRMKTGMMGSQMLAQFGCLSAGGLLGLPIAIWAISATDWQAWLVLVIGVLWGAAALFGGIILGGRIMDTRGSTILQTLVKNDTRERT